METLVINIKNKKDSKLIKELLSRLDVEVEGDKASPEPFGVLHQQVFVFYHND